MKICYFSCSSVFGGIEKIIIDTLNELCKNYEVCLLVPYGCEFRNKLLKEVRIIEYKSYDKRYNPFLYLEVFNVIKDYDIIHTHGAKATQITYLLNKIYSFNHIATKHNTRKGKIFNRVKNVISVSNEVAKTISHESEVLYFGINIKKLNIIKDKIFTITTVGRLDAIKGFDKLINEVSRLDFDFHLNIIGEGSQRKDLEELIEKKNLKNKVFLLGFQDDINQQLSNTHLQVISSLTEGFPLTLIEGMAYSPIILSTPVGGIVEILDENYLAKIDDFSDKISKIFYNYDDMKDDYTFKHSKFKLKFNLNDYIYNLLDYYKRSRDAKTL